MMSCLVDTNVLVYRFADFYGIETLYSEDFQHGRTYGLVRAVNPFR